MTEPQTKKQPRVFPNRASEELYYAGRQFYKSLFIVLVLAIILYLTHFLSKGWTIFFTFVGLILLLATITYSVGHFVRYLVFSAKKQ